MKTISIPFFEGLSLDTMLHHSKNFPAVALHLPAVEEEIRKLPRYYIGNIIYTCVGEPFREWVDKVCEERNQKVIKEQNLEITMDKDIYAAFLNSKHVSTQNCISNNLMKDTAKRRRTKA